MTLNAQLQKAAPVFAALGDETRLHLVVRLAGGQPLPVARLAEGTGITRQAVAKHLRVLELAQLARSSRRGREQIWELDRRRLDAARRCLDRIGSQWEQALDRLRRAVEEDGGSA